MARIFITGSSDGLGQIIARSLIAQGHKVTLHARNPKRGEEAMAGSPGADGVLIADLSSIAQTKQLASEANHIGVFDTVIHNAGVGFQQRQNQTEDGIAHVFAINALAPYILTCLMEKPKRLVYMSSGMHTGGDGNLKDITWTSGRRWNPSQAYSDSKSVSQPNSTPPIPKENSNNPARLQDIILAFAVSRHWPTVSSNAVSPGWVRTKMGGDYAPGSAEKGAEMATWLTSSDPKETGTGKYYVPQGVKEPHKAAKDQGIQEEFLRICEKISGISLRI